MADVFISYSQKDRSLANDLANFLENCGYDVWWDYDLVGGIKFRDQIKKQLALARAVIVIWTESSVESEFVIDEAEDAKQAKKLLPTRAAGLSFKFVPLGFRQLQTDPVDKPDLILKSLEAFGVRPSNAPVAHTPGAVTIGSATVDPANVANAEQFAAWEFIKENKNPADYANFIQVFPDSPLTELARARLAKLEEDEWSQLEGSVLNTPEPLFSFIAKFKGGRFEGAARRKLYSYEQMAWSKLDKEDAARLRAHIDTYRDGFSVVEAQHRLDAILEADKERALWSRLEAAPTREALEEFVKAFPLSARADTARRMLAPVMQAERRAARWAIIKDQGFSEQLRNFIDEFKTGPEVVEAQQRLAKRMVEVEAADWEKVRASIRPVELIRFLAKHPVGAHRDEAIALLRGMPERAEAEAREVAEAAGGAALDGFRAAYPETRHSGAKVVARVVRLTSFDTAQSNLGAAVNQHEPLRWKLAALLFVVGSAVAAFIFIDMWRPLHFIWGYMITQYAAMGLAASFVAGFALYRLALQVLFRRGWSWAAATATAHIASCVPALLWVTSIVLAYSGRNRSVGGLSNMHGGNLGDILGFSAAAIVLLISVAAISLRLPLGWSSRQILYPLICGVVGVCFTVFGFLHFAADGPYPRNYFLSQAIFQYGGLLAGLSLLWFVVVRVREWRAVGRAKRQNAEAGLVSPASA